jgi:hypothetical protein
MKKILSWSALCLLFPFALQAQVSEGGEPMSFSQYFTQVYEKSSPISVHEITPIDLEKVKEETKVGINLNLISRAMQVNLSPENSGKWTTLSNGDRVWRLHVKSKGALALYPFYEHFWLPKGAKLFLYSPDKKQIRGAYSSNTNPPTREFATDGIEGDEMVFEIFEPKEVQGQTKLHINRLDYGVKHEPKDIPKKKTDMPELRIGFGSSNAACQININCALGNDWQTQKKSIVQIRMPLTGGLAVCTGSLIHNDQNKAYVICAWHCQDGLSTSSPYSTWNFGFNWEAPTCTQPGSDPNNRQSLVGCTEKVKSTNSDLLLLELNSTPPSNYNVYYNGWDRTGTTPTSVTGIHHPAGDIKKISVNTGTTNINANSITFGGGATDLVIPAGNLWTFSWTQGDTEGGSSGSPLFDQNKRVIGTLTGGSGDCNSNNFSAYGRMSVHWNLLQPFLSSTDPTRTIMNGFDPNANVPNAGVTTIATTTSACDLNANVPMTITIRNHGANALASIPYSWTLTHPTAGSQSGNGTVNNLASLASTDVTVNLNMSATSGTYTFTAKTDLASDGNTADDTKNATFTNTSATTGSSGITFGEADGVFKMRVNFTKGNGEGRLVLMKEGSSFSIFDLPTQGQSYSSNATFKLGSKIGDAYVVYRGSGVSAPILDGLTLNNNYYVAIIEYSCGTKYLLGEQVAYGSKVFTANERDFLGSVLSVFPNPSQTGKQICVELPNTLTEQPTWEIQNLQGQTIQLGNFDRVDDKLKAEISTIKQRAGLYLLRVRSGKHTTIRKVVLQ